jgi:hypothetical protein
MAGQKREARLRTDDPAIHDLLFAKQDVDARHKAGHDEGKQEGRERSRPFFYFVIPGRAKREPGISRFRVWSFGPSRNDDDEMSSSYCAASSASSRAG